jgi:hypothetical protein
MNPLSKLILQGQVVDNQKVLVDFRDGRFVFEPVAVASA